MEKIWICKVCKRKLKTKKDLFYHYWIELDSLQSQIALELERGNSEKNL